MKSAHECSKENKVNGVTFSPGSGTGDTSDNVTCSPGTVTTYPTDPTASGETTTAKTWKLPELEKEADYLIKSLDEAVEELSEVVTPVSIEKLCQEAIAEEKALNIQTPYCLKLMGVLKQLKSIEQKILYLLERTRLVPTEDKGTDPEGISLDVPAGITVFEMFSLIDSAISLLTNMEPEVEECFRGASSVEDGFPEMVPVPESKWGIDAGINSRWGKIIRELKDLVRYFREFKCCLDLYNPEGNCTPEPNHT